MIAPSDEPLPPLEEDAKTSLLVASPISPLRETEPLLPSDGTDGTEAVSGEGLTVRALITGCVLGIVVAAMNVSFGLKVFLF